MQVSHESPELLALLEPLEALPKEQFAVLKWAVAREDRFRQALEEAQQGQRETDQWRGMVRSFIASRVKNLKGPQIALLGAYYQKLNGVENYGSRVIGSQMEEWTGTRPANITSLMETLKDRGHIICQGEDTPGAHKTFQITATGVAEAEKMIRSLEVLEPAA